MRCQQYEKTKNPPEYAAQTTTPRLQKPLPLTKCYPHNKQNN